MRNLILLGHCLDGVLAYVTRVTAAMDAAEAWPAVAR
jgi:hypothetical protein